MSKTRHFQARMSQRAIDQSLVDLVLDFGALAPDGKRVLSRKALEVLGSRLTQIQKHVQNALRKGGVVVVEDDGMLITTYRLDSYSPNRTSAA